MAEKLREGGVAVSVFSNGTEFDCFSDRNCWNCVKDGFIGAGPDDAQCELLDVVMLENADVPDAWEPTGGIDRYRCTAKVARS